MSAVPTTATIPLEEDVAWQEAILPGVSRTFALTIPQLPSGLEQPVTTAYLLCRIADTIEDEPSLSLEHKRAYSDEFAKVVGGKLSAAAFAARLRPLLSDGTLEAERELVEGTARVIRVLESFSEPVRQAIRRCIRIMCAGMERFQLNASLDGLADLDALNRYCYHVAGVVGEMLTTLFCEYSSAIDRHREELEGLAVSFGQGLQMTNILKDVWDDRGRGACWLPRAVFRSHGFDLRYLAPGRQDEAFEKGMRELIGIAHGHLRNALRYTLYIPPNEVGIRRFALWAIGMALLTLRKIARHLDFEESRTVKIKRSSVKATIAITNLTGRSDALLKLLFGAVSVGLPKARQPQ